MGYRAWQAHGHQVRRGEQSVSILAPCAYKKKARAQPSTDAFTDESADSDHDDEEGGQGSARRVLRGFRVAHVFDISQTEGDSIRPPERPRLLAGDAPTGLWDTLAAQVERAGFTLLRAEIPSGANGVTSFATRTVTVASGLPAAQAAKTLAHELAHTALHDGTEYAAGCRGRVEIEAESVAYILCTAAGLHSGAYSFGYVAHWAGGDAAAVKDTAERVIATARSLLEATGFQEAQTGPTPNPSPPNRPGRPPSAAAGTVNPQPTAHEAMSESGGNRPKRANLIIGTKWPKQSGPASHPLLVGDATMIRGILAAWALIGFIACLTGCDS